MNQKQEIISLPRQFVIITSVIVISLLLLSTKTCIISVSTTDQQQQHYYYINAFHLIQPVPTSSKKYNDISSQDRYLGVKETSSSLLQATTRRQSFGDLLGSSLALPAIVDTVTNVQPAYAADDYPFKLTVEKLGKAFPNAVTNAELITKVTRALNRYGYDEKTLVAFSLCSDEVNRPLEETFNGWYGEHFNLGGLAGFPFSGVTGYGAFASHIPDNGSCLLVYGPHVGVDSNGAVGKVDRKGKSKTSTCCGSAVAASRYITAVYKGEAEKVGFPTDSVDAQQNYVAAALLPYAERVVKATDPMVELPFATFEPIDSMMQRIVGKVKTGGKVAMLGGLQINTPRGVSDYFLPLRFDIRDGKTNEIIEDLLWKRNVGTESRKRMT